MTVTSDTPQENGGILSADGMELCALGENGLVVTAQVRVGLTGVVSASAFGGVLVTVSALAFSCSLSVKLDLFFSLDMDLALYQKVTIDMNVRYLNQETQAAWNLFKDKRSNFEKVEEEINLMAEQVVLVEVLEEILKEKKEIADQTIAFLSAVKEVHERGFLLSKKSKKLISDMSNIHQEQASVSQKVFEHYRELAMTGGTRTVRCQNLKGHLRDAVLTAELIAIS